MLWNHGARMVRALVLSAALLLPLAGGAEAQVFNPTTFELDNGMQVVVIENNRLCLGIALLRVGSEVVRRRVVASAPAPYAGVGQQEAPAGCNRGVAYRG